ncbi:MAG: energy-dependent translational throttle protein EttA [Alphaproteobacteria bacterium]|nr:energy-dependent translational throttle protein EttA [Alphaproteobacteria bacterium]
MAEQFIYYMHGTSKSYAGGKKVLDNINLSFYPDAKIGVVGVNGSGKSTLLRILAGLDTDFTGEAWAAEGAKIGYLPQEPQLDESLTVRDNVMLGVAEKKAIMDAYNELSMKLAEPMDDDEMMEVINQQAELQDRIDSENLWDLDAQIEMAMEALRCPPGDAEVAPLSGGEKRRVALCKLLLERPNLLLLDEPTNHLDAETVAWLENYLKNYEGAVILVTHDRYFLDNVTGWILELDRGRGIPYQGNYSSWLEQKQQRLEAEGKSEEARQRTLSREMEYVKSSPSARRAKSKARIKAYEDLLNRAEEEKSGRAQIIIPHGDRLGQKVIEVQGLTKAYGDRLLFENLEFRLPAGGIVGVIGPNGAGKTTLFRMLTGQETPDAGSIELGDTVHMGYVDQTRDALNGAATVFEEITGNVDVLKLGKTEMHSRAYVGAFNFRGGDQQKKVGQLSGGERNRVHMAKLLRGGYNVLLLDEPTNDLDVETLQALEAALEDFAGCAVIISHDRWFLDRIATHILAFEGDSHVEWFEGNFEDYEQDKKRRLGPDAVEPKRVQYRRLTRD